MHLGVVVIAVGFAASMSFAARDEFRLKPGPVGADLRPPRHLPGCQDGEALQPHVDRGVRAHRQQKGLQARAEQLSLCQSGHRHAFRRGGFLDDVYLTLVAAPTSVRGTAVIGVVVTPLVNWLWAGGAIIALGTGLALVPGRRRLPTAAASAPVVTPSLSGGTRMRRRRVAPWIAAAVGLVLVFVIVVAWNAKPAEQRIADSPLVGKPAPAVAGDTLSAQTGTTLRSCAASGSS